MDNVEKFYDLITKWKKKVKLSNINGNININNISANHQMTRRYKALGLRFSSFGQMRNFGFF